eukprot:gb/GECH01010522.1/.p1 GENE.gb/GECH01010522.1/~~gb/GECH01010522.1/.p1  ORF type:complete len:116 (+),score=8.50 gb/GECH01010522.1/:1-348(+)
MTTLANPEYKKIPYPSQGFSSFQEFYPYYLGEHSNQICRRLHVIGTTGVMLMLTLLIITQNPYIFPFVPFCGYSFAWVGHFFFEQNKPATFKHPIYSLIGDFKLWYETITGKRAF